MNKEICKKCEKYSEYFVLKQKRKFNIIKRYFYGDNGYCLKEKSHHCLIVESYNVHYPIFLEIKKVYTFDEISSRKSIEPDKEICPYYAEHQLNDWNKNNEY